MVHHRKGGGGNHNNHNHHHGGGQQQQTYEANSILSSCIDAIIDLFFEPVELPPPPPPTTSHGKARRGRRDHRGIVRDNNHNENNNGHDEFSQHQQRTTTEEDDTVLGYLLGWIERPILQLFVILILLTFVFSAVLLLTASSRHNIRLQRHYHLYDGHHVDGQHVHHYHERYDIYAISTGPDGAAALTLDGSLEGFDVGPDGHISILPGGSIVDGLGGGGGGHQNDLGNLGQDPYGSGANYATTSFLTRQALGEETVRAVVQWKTSKEKALERRRLQINRFDRDIRKLEKEIELLGNDIERKGMELVTVVQQRGGGGGDEGATANVEGSGSSSSRSPPLCVGPWSSPEDEAKGCQRADDLQTKVNTVKRKLIKLQNEVAHSKAEELRMVSELEAFMVLRDELMKEGVAMERNGEANYVKLLDSFLDFVAEMSMEEDERTMNIIIDEEGASAAGSSSIAAPRGEPAYADGSSGGAASSPQQHPMGSGGGNNRMVAASSGNKSPPPPEEEEEWHPTEADEERLLQILLAQSESAHLAVQRGILEAMAMGRGGGSAASS